MTGSTVWSALDLDAEGKDADYLRIPHSIDTSAYGWVPIPVIRIKSGTGPTILLCAGNHGDEYEGQVALLRLAREIEPQDVNGRLLIFPALNFPAVRAARRVSPLDEVNLNRSFPGRAVGSPTEMLAHFIVEELFPRSDFVIDLHSGGRSLIYTYSALGHYGKSSDTDASIKELLQVFGAPLSILTQGSGGGGSTTLYAAAANRGIPAITSELGGGATLDATGKEFAENGVRRILAHYGVWRKDPVPDHPRTQFAQSLPRTLAVYAPHSGLFEPFVMPGSSIHDGQIAGVLYHVDNPLLPPTELKFRAGGIVSCRRAVTYTQLGDCLFNLVKLI